MNTFKEIEDTIDKFDWCIKNIGPVGDGWRWDLDSISDEERTGIVIEITDDEFAMAYKLRWC